jgi:hypothetical protein
MSTQDQLTRKELVKVFTRVPPQFVDDFYDILSAEALDNNFVIDLENACKWLDTRKDRLVKTLKESYKNDVDYKIIKIKKEFSERESRGGHNHKQIKSCLLSIALNVFVCDHVLQKLKLYVRISLK